MDMNARSALPSANGAGKAALYGEGSVYDAFELGVRGERLLIICSS